MNIALGPQSTKFTLDILGRYVCNTFDEALVNSDPTARAAAGLGMYSNMRPFDFIILGAGTFGGALAEHLWFRSTGRSERILVVDAGPFLLPAHVQNLPMLSLGNEVWGLPWNSNIASAGLAYCVGGRSIFWGGWSPRPLDSETPVGIWPQSVLDDLNHQTLPNRENGYFRQAGQQIGVTATNDFIFGPLHKALRERLCEALGSRAVPEAVPLAEMPDSPPVEFMNAEPASTDLAALLDVSLPDPVPDGFLQELRNKLKLEAPLAVQARPEHAGFFPMSKFSTVPLMIKAARAAYRESNGDDVQKRFMIVPRCHVTRLHMTNEPAGRRIDAIHTERGTIPVSPKCKVILALGAVESTRLALLSFGGDGLIGSNLMVHLRSNVDFRIPREALAGLPDSSALQTSALFVKGKHNFKGPDGTEGHFHLQITASGLGSVGTNSEAELFQTIPDIDTVNQHLLATDTHIVITIRGIGEMQPRNPNNNVTLDLNPTQTDFGERKAYVNLHASDKDKELWDAMDKAIDELAAGLAKGHQIDIIGRSTGQVIANNVDATALEAQLPHTLPDSAHPNGRRDGLGSTHHEAGTLRMGDDPATSVTDAHGRFHSVVNAYTGDLAAFPTVGSPNPMLIGIALARRLGDHLLP
jgi:choline dehydrogenase-like flavoprotein